MWAQLQGNFSLMMLDSAEILQEEVEVEENADALWATAEEDLVTEETSNDDIITVSIEKSVLLFWGWVGFGVAILSFYFPLLPGLSFAGLATWAILKSSPHLAERFVRLPWIKRHLAVLKGDQDLPAPIKYTVGAAMALIGLAIFLTKGQLALVAFGLFVCLPLISVIWGKPFNDTQDQN
ncbi:MAG: DUF454 family protein [Alphaproteobacteria bacterium]|nr:MAG: DUF454 family protein [Alphaproteobacteria bacterium]